MKYTGHLRSSNLFNQFGLFLWRKKKSMFVEEINGFHTKLVFAWGGLAKMQLLVFSASHRAHAVWVFKDQNKIHYLVLNEALVLMQYKSNCRQSLNHN